MKVKTLVSIDEKKKYEVETLKKLTGKSMSNLVEEGITILYAKYSHLPSTFDEAIKQTAGIGKGKIEYVREKLNTDIVRRSKGA